MSSLFFWRDWVKEYRYTWLVTAVVFCFSIAFLWYGYFSGPDGVINWSRLQEQKTIETNVHTFRMGPFEINVPGESYVIFEHFNASRLHPNISASYVFLAVFALAFIVLISVVTTLEKFWYFFGMTLVILLLISLRFEVLGLFGSHHLITAAGVIGVYAIPSVYFNLFRSRTPLLYRVLTFTVITIFLCIVTVYFSTVPFPFYHLYLTSFTGSLILSLIFVVLVGHEIIGGFVYLVGQGSSKSMQHLLFMSTIYLINIFITALHELHVIKWDFFYVNAYLLLSISALIGIWGYRNREAVYGNIMAFYPFAALIYLSLGAICFATIAHLLINFNDPGLKVVREIIIFVHAGYGIMFLLYLISNYGDLFTSNAPAYRVMYRPRRMPYFSYRLAGLIATLAFVVYANWRDYLYHGMAAFYNIAGDLHTRMQNETFAESFYQQAQRQGFQNFRSSYMLAQIKSSKLNIKDAIYYYDLANEKGANEYSLVNSGNIHLWTNEYFKAIKAYSNGLKAEPESAHLANNAGIAYMKVKNVDSAAFFLNQARDNETTRSIAEMNFFGLAASEYIPLKSDSLLRAFNASSPGTISNALAVATVFHAPFSYEVDPLEYKKLNLQTATLLNNYIIHNAKQIDSVFINEAYRIASDPDNAAFSEALKASLAFGFYHQGNISRAMEVLGEQVLLSQSYQGKFNYIMGLWAMEQGNPERASTFFSYADTHDFKDARFYNAIALTEAGLVRRAIAAWDTVLVYGEAAEKQIATRIKRILTLSPADANGLGDAERYQFCRYRINTGDSLLFNRLSDQFQDPNYKAQALLDMSRKYFEAGQIIPAIRYYQRIGGLRLTDRRLYEETRHFELRMLASRGEVYQLANQINDGIEFTSDRNLEKMFYTALISEANGDTLTASQNYRILATYNPYFEEAVIAAYRYFRKTEDKNLYPYTILAEAIQVNPTSLPLLYAYREEAMRVGLDEYAENVNERIKALEARRN